MNKIDTVVFYVILAVLGLFMSHFYSKQLAMEHGYALGVGASLVLWVSLGCGGGVFKNMSKNKRKLATTIAVLLAVIGGAIWFMARC